MVGTCYAPYWSSVAYVCLLTIIQNQLLKFQYLSKSYDKKEIPKAIKIGPLLNLKSIVQNHRKVNY